MEILRDHGSPSHGAAYSLCLQLLGARSNMLTLENGWTLKLQFHYIRSSSTVTLMIPSSGDQQLCQL